jgi:hypothetical protein
MISPNQTDNYEAKKSMLEDIKTFSKDECQELFRILKQNNVQYTENSNGIFFDLVPIDNEIFYKLLNFVDFTKAQKKSEEVRVSELNVLRQETLELNKSENKQNA